MKKKWWVIVAVVVGFIVLLLVVVPYLINVDNYRPEDAGMRPHPQLRIQLCDFT